MGYNGAQFSIYSLNLGVRVNQRGIHGTWASRWTFILAATGSAVGLGNIWKFPYIAGENGGGAFVLVYLLCILLIGVPVMMAEVLIGRRGRQSPINSMRFVAKEAGLSPRWAAIGWMGVLAGLFIMAFYSVVAGWALKYVFVAGSGLFNTASAEQIGANFSQMLSEPGTLLLWHTVFTVMTAGVVACGITRGLGSVAKYMMPFLFVALLILVGYSFAHGDFGASLAFLFAWDFAQLSWGGVLEALGHAFFTLSLGMGAIMAYGAYMPARASLAKTVVTVGVLDTLVALTAGLAIFPIVFATAGLEPGAGPGLLFVSLPVAFGGMPLGTMFGTLFFLLIAIAAWSSAVSLLEPGVAWLIESKKFNRIQATAILACSAWLLGISCVLSFNHWEDFTPVLLLGMNPFNFLDFLTTWVMLPLGGLFIAIFVGWFMHKKVVERELEAEGHPLFDIWHFVVRYVSPALIVLVMLLALINHIF